MNSQHLLRKQQCRANSSMYQAPAAFGLQELAALEAFIIIVGCDGIFIDETPPALPNRRVVEHFQHGTVSSANHFERRSEITRVGHGPEHFTNVYGRNLGDIRGRISLE